MKRVPPQSLPSLKRRFSFSSDSTRAEFSDGNIFVTATLDGAVCELDVLLANGPILAGAWQTEIFAEGKKLRPRGDWESVCADGDKTRMYWEISRPMGSVWRHERHLLLIPDANLLFVADAIRSDPFRAGNCPRLQSVSTWGLPESVVAMPHEEAWEMTLARQNVRRTGSRTVRPQTRIFPLTLPEWRTDSAAGTLNVAEGHLTSSVYGEGGGLFAPLLFDFNAGRLAKPYTWRHLTVGAQREKVADAVARGYRVQMGRDQFLIYRSLGPLACRSVLGEHFDQEFVVARFVPGGKTDVILQIVPEEGETA